VVLWYIEKINQMKKRTELEKEFAKKLRVDLEKHFDVISAEKLIKNFVTGGNVRTDFICFIRMGTPEIEREFFMVECKKPFDKKVRLISDAFHQLSEHVHECKYVGKKALFGLIASPEIYDGYAETKVYDYMKIITQHEALKNLGHIKISDSGDIEFWMSKMENKKALFTPKDGFDLEQLAQKQGSKRVRTYRNESI